MGVIAVWRQLKRSLVILKKGQQKKIQAEAHRLKRKEIQKIA